MVGVTQVRAVVQEVARQHGHRGHVAAIVSAQINDQRPGVGQHRHGRGDGGCGVFGTIKATQVKVADVEGHAFGTVHAKIAGLHVGQLFSQFLG